MAIPSLPDIPDSGFLPASFMETFIRGMNEMFQTFPVGTAQDYFTGVDGTFKQLTNTLEPESLITKGGQINVGSDGDLLINGSWRPRAVLHNLVNQYKWGE